MVEKAGVPLMIGFNRRFDPNFAALQRRLADGTAGEVELVTILSRDPGPPPVSYIERSGGLFRDMMIHDFDMARFLLGEDATEVYRARLLAGRSGDRQGRRRRHRRGADADRQSARSARSPTRAAPPTATTSASRCTARRACSRPAMCTRRRCCFPATKGITADPVQNFFLERYAAAYRHEIDAFIDAMEKGTKPSPDGTDGLKAQLMADAATKSRETGKPVTIG